MKDLLERQADLYDYIEEQLTRIRMGWYREGHDPSMEEVLEEIQRRLYW